MHRRFPIALGLATLLTLSATTASAQFYGGYGGARYGWGGWGATPQGDIARGMGMYAQGMGQYNVETSQARSINADTMMRWNSYVQASQHALNFEHYARMNKERAQNTAATNAIADRVTNNPNQVDIQHGDALNAILTQLSDPRVHPSALRLARIPLPADWIQEIPFRYASETITLSLHRLTSESDWPLALKADALTAERQAYQKAIDAALAEDKEGDLKPESIQAVRGSIDALRAKLEATTADKNDRDYFEAEKTLRGMTGMARMLESPSVEKTLAALETYPGTTVADLLAFMQMFNLRFAEADEPDEIALYEKLYPLLDAQRDAILKDQAVSNALATPAPAPAPGIAPTQIFHDVPWEHLNGQAATPTGSAPAPTR